MCTTINLEINISSSDLIIKLSIKVVLVLYFVVSLLLDLSNKNNKPCPLNQVTYREQILLSTSKTTKFNVSESSSNLIIELSIEVVYYVLLSASYCLWATKTTNRCSFKSNQVTYHIRSCNTTSTRIIQYEKLSNIWKPIEVCLSRI